MRHGYGKYPYCNTVHKRHKDFVLFIGLHKKEYYLWNTQEYHVRLRTTTNRISPFKPVLII